MLNCDSPNALRITQGHLLRAAEQFEILPPSEHGTHLSQHHRNRGIGSVLLKEILHYCKHHDVHRVTGGIEDGAASLREWFRRHGFAIVNDGWLEFHFA